MNTSRLTKLVVSAAIIGLVFSVLASRALGAEEEITSSTPPNWVEKVREWPTPFVGLQPGLIHFLYRVNPNDAEKNSALLTYEMGPHPSSAVPTLKVGRLIMALWLDEGGNKHRWVLDKLEGEDPTKELPTSKF